MAYKDLTGEKFGRLTVIKFVKKVKYGRQWELLCECGGTCFVVTADLNRGHTTSCGCATQEARSRNGKANTTHGCSIEKGDGYSEFITWMSLKARCLNPKDKGYPNYGGRGITVCDRWKNSFETFLADMGKRPEGCEIDRINNNGNYEPSNCRWTTRIIQHNNKRNNIFVTYKDECMTMAQWARKYNVKANSLRSNLVVAFKPFPQAITSLKNNTYEHHNQGEQ